MLRTRSRRLVGRAEELKLLRDAVKRARGGTTTVVLVQGEPGIGKSSLLAAALDASGRPDDIVMVGHGVPMGGEELPFGVVADAVADLVRQLGRDRLLEESPTACATLGWLVPELRPDGVDDTPGRSDLIEAVAALIAERARHALVWLVIEDLQWADASSRDVLAFLTRVVGRTRLLVTYTVRDHPVNDGRPAVARFMDELMREPAVTVLRLARLSQDQVAEQIATLSEGTAEPQLVSRAVTLSQGVPFLVEELITGGLRSDGPLPVTAAQLMRHRMSELSRPAAYLVQACSVQSGSLPHALLATICDLEAAALADACEEAVGAQVLEVDETGLAYRFRHTLLRESVQESLMPADRLRWHAAWARQLESSASAQDGSSATIAAAHHWAKAGDTDRAFTATVAAADVARALGASAELATLLPRLLDLWKHASDPATRARSERDQILDETIDMMIQADEWSAGLELIDRELAMVPDDRVRVTALRVRRRWFLEQLGRDEDLAVDRAGAFTRLMAAPPGPLITEALIRLGFELVTSAPDLAAQAHQRSVEVADISGTPRDQLWARSQLALHLAAVGRPDAALQIADEVLTDMRASSPNSAAPLEAECSWWLCSLGRHQEAVEVGLTALDRIGRAERARRTWAVATAHLCVAQLSMGRWDLASIRLGQARSEAAAGTRGAVLSAVRGVLSCWEGDLAAAEAAAEAARGQLPDDVDRVWPAVRAWLGWLEAETTVGLDDIDELRRRMSPLWGMDGVEVASYVLWRPILLAARFEADLTGRTFGRRGGSRRPGPSAAGAEHLEQLRTAAARLHTTGDVAAAWRAQLDAECARFEGADDADSWVEVARRWDGLGQPHDRGWALLRAGECYAAAGDRKNALTSLRGASAIGERLGARPLTSVVGDAVRAARIELGLPRGEGEATVPSGALALTPRELEVLTLVALGSTNDRIARQLFISPKTASVHVTHILAKLGVHSRTEAAATAHRLRLLP